ncbi:MAG: Ig-like domain-containing protein [Flavipsychrobacter sp.]|nr:Ig-like domain-containing protein [Flavipsychrobacter sp.]
MVKKIYYRFWAPSVTSSSSFIKNIYVSASNPVTHEGYGNGYEIRGPGVYTITASNSGPFCVGNPINLSASDPGNATFNWTGPSGFTSTVNTPVLSGATLSNAGTYSVVVTASTCTVTSTTAVTISNTVAPTISSVSPSSGNVGTSVTITGTNFSSDPTVNRVFFGATQATVTSASATSLTMNVPSGASYSPLSLSVGGCNLSTTSLYHFTPTFNNSTFAPGTVNFASRLDFSTGSGFPSQIRSTDIDGDTKSDLVFIDQSANKLIIWRNTGTAGTVAFSSPLLLTANNPSGLAIADINGDGKPDVLTSNESGGVFSLFTNTSTPGNTSFATRIDYGSGTEDHKLAVGDLDMDGRPDVAVTNFTQNSVSIFKNTSTVSTISFASGVNFATGTNPSDIAIGTISYDGMPDIAVACYSDSVSVLRNTFSGGTISFASKVDFEAAASGDPIAITLGNFNNNNAQDLVIANNYAENLTLYSNSSGSSDISLSVHLGFQAGICADVELADLSGDGKTEIVSNRYGEGKLSVRLNTGTTSTTPFSGQKMFDADTSVWGIAIADLNNDGKQDIATCNPYSSSISIFINAPLNQISGPSSVCVSSSISLSNATSGGTWSSSNSGIATVGSSSGVVFGVAAGTAVISYTTAGGSATKIVTVTTTSESVSISGPTTTCSGSSASLSASISGGTWSSSNSGIATVGTGGLVTGVSAGVVTISYNVPTGCGTSYATHVFTTETPADAGSITGVSSLCAGATASYSNTVTGGTWSSSAPATGSINTAGVLTGLAAGVVTISYGTTNSCGINYSTFTTTVNSTPAASTLTGTTSLCQGGSTTISATMTGGSWSTSNSSIANVGTAGIVSGVSAGTAHISYTRTNACGSTSNMIVVTVQPLPSSVTISGGPTVCVGATTSLTGSIAGGTWASNDVGIASIGSASGMVTGVASGTTRMTYALTTGCGTGSATIVMSVNVLSPAISGSTAICVGGTATLSHPVSGGTWSSSNSSIASVGTTGIVTGIANGTTNITYSTGTGCYRTIVVTVGLPAISGPSHVCVGSGITLSHPATGGTWTVSNTSLANIGTTSGSLTGLAIGTVQVTYTTSTGCFQTRSVTIQNIPISISGPSLVCVGANATLTSTTGGSWTSGNTSVATINASTGTYSGVSAGTTNITYTIGGCSNTTAVTVNPIPANISGSLAVCTGNTTTLSNSTSGGTWSSSNTSKATIGSTTGVVTGVASGTSVISYTLTTGCRITATVSVGVLPAVITGLSSLCVGNTTSLASTTTGGSWSSSNTSIASTGTNVSSTTIITGIATGTSTITYTTTGCVRTSVITVNPAPDAITGATTICSGSTSTLSSATTGGTWSGSSGTIASVSSSGVVTGVSTGTATITYKTAPACYTSTNVTVTAAPAAIAGSGNGCMGQSTYVSHPIAGGTWSSSNIAVATINGTSGMVTGITTGSTTITYAISAGCFKTRGFYVYAVPGAITGADTVCMGAITTQGNPVGGGTWTSSDPDVAAVNVSSGVVSGTDAGTATITYRVTSTGCYSTRVVTVNSLPEPITGFSSLCSGSADTLQSATTGGKWTSSSGSVATIGSSTGIVSGISAGNTNITYSLPTGCKRVNNITVNSTPATVSGTTILCVGNTTVLTSGTSGQSWSSSNSSIATVGSLSSTTGTLTGIGAGTATISYTNAAGCARTIVVTVNGALPATAGPSTVCQGQSVSLSNSTGGGSWTSSSSAKASVGSASGVVTGVSIGTANITYSIGTGCMSIVQVTVNPSVAAISGSTNVCAGSSTTLSHSATGGTWSVANTTLAMIDGSTGTITGLAQGTTLVSYILSAGCFKTASFTVKPQPADITGTTSIAVASTATLSCTTGGGTWTSSAPSIASVGNTTGIATGISIGSATITYRVTATGCSAIRSLEVVATGGRPAVAEPQLSSFSLFPNPTTRSFSVITSTNGVFRLLSMDGKLIMSQQMTSGTTVVNMPEDIAPGVYISDFAGNNGDRNVIRLIFEP